MNQAQRLVLRARILRNIRIDDETGCWIWTARKNNGGYGIITMRVAGYPTPRPLFAHRVSYEAFRRGIPEGLLIAHACDRRACCNPKHLRATTASENCRDRYRRRPPKHVLLAMAATP